MHTPKRRPAALRYLQSSWQLYAMLIPAFVALVLFAYMPMYGIIIAFKRYNPGLGILESPWVGMANFELLFRMPAFESVILNTVIISVLKLITVQVCAVVLSIMLHNVASVVLKRSVQSIIYLPHFLSWIVLGGIILDLLSARGIFNTALGQLGLDPILFLGSNDWFRPTLVISNLWKEVGWSTIIFLAALTAIDPSLHEAAAIDGANRFQRLFSVVLPGILPTIVLVGTLALGGLLSAGFEQVLTLYSPVVYSTGDIIDTFVYRTGLVTGQYSLATAVGLFQSVIGMFLIVLSWFLARKYAGYHIF